MNNTQASSLSTQESEVNEYLLLRQVKIKRNQERLKELGLLHVNQKPAPLSSSLSSLAPPPQSQTQGQTPNHPDESIHTRFPTRRSLRLNNDSPYRNSNTAASSQPQQQVLLASPSSTSPSPSLTTTSSLTTATTTSTSRSKQTKRQPKKQKTIIESTPPIQPGTTRSISLHVQKILCGPHFDYPVFVGRTLSSTGKATVLAHACCMCDKEQNVSFNKYSGVCEFQNDVIFLWVNMNTPDSEVKNDFVVVKKNDKDGNDKDDDDDDEEQVQMTWFGGSRMRMDSPTIQRLLDIGKRASAGELSESCGIVLWYRLYNFSKRQFEPYSCLGRLGYHHHESESHPVKFIFNLLDYKYLKVASRPNTSLSLWNEILLQMQHQTME